MDRESFRQRDLIAESRSLLYASGGLLDGVPVRDWFLVIAEFCSTTCFVFFGLPFVVLPSLIWQ